MPRMFLLFVISPRERVQRAVGWCVEFLVTILRRRQTCPAEGANPTRRTRAAIPLWLTRRKRRKEGVCPRNPERNRPKRPPAVRRLKRRPRKHSGHQQANQPRQTQK